MKKLNILLLTSLTIFSMLFLAACENKEEVLVEEKRVETKKIERIEANISKEEKGDLLHQLGFDFKDEKIVIDINKTSHFFEQLEVQMQDTAKEIETKIANSELNMSEGMGIQLEGEQIGIDLNKSKNMLQQINILMKDIFLDINASKH